MTVGLVGLGKMGQAIARKLTAAEHTVVGYDVAEVARASAASVCTVVAEKWASFFTRLPAPRLVWLMVPATAVDEALGHLREGLGVDDGIVDGGNSFFEDTKRRAAELAAAGIRFVDVGVSGGPAGDAQGFSLMVGGEPADVERIDPLLRTLSVPAGAYGHLGPSGAGHFVKMIHNGIEYGMMESLAEGVDVLAHGPYPLLNLGEIARVWQRGSVIRSYLVDLLAEILTTEDFETVRGVAEATGEGEWTVRSAQAHGIAVPAIQAAVQRREESQRRELYAAKILALLRNRFGGHPVKRRS